MDSGELAGQAALIYGSVSAGFEAPRVTMLPVVRIERINSGRPTCGHGAAGDIRLAGRAARQAASTEIYGPSQSRS